MVERERWKKSVRNGWCVRDRLRKVPTAGHLGDVEPVTFFLLEPLVMMTRM